MLIEMSLAIILVITFFNVILGATFTTYNAGTSYGVTVGINEVTGALAVVIALVALAVVVGIQVLGSGISEQSVKTIITVIGYASLWGVFSVLSSNLIISIELFGLIIYLILTIIYAIGVMNKISQ